MIPLAGICWVIFALCKHKYWIDWPVLIPNFLGIILGITQIYVYFYYKKLNQNVFQENLLLYMVSQEIVKGGFQIK